MKFSVRAARELRLADLLGEQVAAAVAAATRHSVSARMLREAAVPFGRTVTAFLPGRASRLYLASSRLLVMVVHSGSAATT